MSTSGESVVLERPRSADEVLELLDRHGEAARLMAGGTALMLMLRFGLFVPDVVVSLSDVQGLDRIEVGRDGLHLGAIARLRNIERSAVVLRTAPLLADTLRLVANVRVRNAATIGGNLGEADYASDLPCVLMVLDARVRVENRRGERVLQMGELLAGHYETTLEPDELITEVIVPPLAAGARGVYSKFVTRSEEDRPCVGVAVVAVFDDEVCRELRVSVGAASAVPYRLREVEETMCETRFTEDVIGHVADAYADSGRMMSDLRGSRDYRRRMVKILVERALTDVTRGCEGARRI